MTVDDLLARAGLPGARVSLSRAHRAADRAALEQAIPPGCPSSAGVLCGLLLHAGDWNAAHHTVDSLATPETSYWHALVHRMEPDYWNSNYWFRQSGRHRIFADVAKFALSAGYPLRGAWDPAAFNEFCQDLTPGGEQERQAAAIHAEECRLLLAHSAGLLA